MAMDGSFVDRELEETQLRARHLIYIRWGFGFFNLSLQKNTRSTCTMLQIEAFFFFSHMNETIFK